jgi:hypothetical protein
MYSGTGLVKKKYAFDWSVMFGSVRAILKISGCFFIESRYQVSSKASEDFIYVFVCLKTLYLTALSVSETLQLQMVE